MDNCLFCRIARGEVPATIVHRDADCVAFRDIHPQAPTHILIIPTRHITALADLQDTDHELMGRMLLTARDIARRENLGGGYRLVTNVGRDGGQSVFHLHFHLLGGRSMHWPPG